MRDIIKTGIMASALGLSVAALNDGKDSLSDYFGESGADPNKDQAAEGISNIYQNFDLDWLIAIGAFITALQINKRLSLRETAYHEAGHTLSAIYFPAGRKIQYATIIGSPTEKNAHVSFYDLPENEELSKEELLNGIMCLVSGRIAEGLFKKGDGAGYGNDYFHANLTAKEILEYFDGHNHLFKGGLANRALESKSLEEFLLRGLLEKENDRFWNESIKAFIQEAEKKARAFFEENYDKLELLAEELLKRKVMSAEQIYDLLGLEYPELTREEYAQNFFWKEP